MSPPLPPGYFGNVLAFPAAVTTAAELSRNPLHYAVELVRKAKKEASGEYLRSVAGLMVMRNRPGFAVAGSYLVSDLTRMGLDGIDFGWGAAAYGGIAKGTNRSGVEVSWCVPFKNKMGESGTLLPVCLPLHSMEVFNKQFQMTMTLARKTSAL